MDIRRATASDLDAVVAIIESQRKQYQKFQPTFWHKAPDSAATAKTFFAELLVEPDTYFLVSTEGRQILGFLIARKFAAPPV
ncbi:MAG: N-acetyltransferase family protein, partial [Rhodospirillaceae bacterium]